MGSQQAAVSFLTNLARAAFGLGASATLLSSSLYTVDGGQRAVLFDRFRGILDETVGEGTHFLIPWVQKPYIFDIRTRPHTFSSVSGTKDLQMVNLTLRVLSRPDTDKLSLIVQNLGLEYDEKVLPSRWLDLADAVCYQQGSSGGGEGFEVRKFGHGRVVIGFPRLEMSPMTDSWLRRRIFWRPVPSVQSCVIRGCVPKKLLVYASKFSHEFEESNGFGWRYDSEPKHDWSSLIANKNAELQRLTGIYKNILNNAGVKLIEGHGKVA